MVSSGSPRSSLAEASRSKVISITCDTLAARPAADRMLSASASKAAAKACAVSALGITCPASMR